MNKTIGQKTVTYDFERLMPGAKLLKCSEFGQALVKNMWKEDWSLSFQILFFPVKRRKGHEKVDPYF